MLVPRRLDKHLRDHAPLCRRAILAAVRGGRVEVQARGALGEGAQGEAAQQGAREVVREPHRLIYPAEDRVWLDGEPLGGWQPSCYLALHKPLGVVSVAREPSGKPCLDPWLAALPPGVFAVGRLDRDTSGLLLLTDDGALGFALMSPRHHVPRVYVAEVAAHLTPDDARLRALASPLALRDGPAQAVSVSLLWSDAGAQRAALEVVVGEGRKRQVRRMVAAARLDLVTLHRVRLGPVTLGVLPPGAVRALSAAEVAALWHAAGGADVPERGALRALRAQAEDWRGRGQADARLEAWLSAVN